MRRIICGCIILFMGVGICGSDRIAGDLTDTQQQVSFSFPITSPVFNQFTREVFVGARDMIPASNEQAQPFAISVLPPNGSAFRALAPEHVVMNGALVSNPLHGAGIRFLRVIQNLPLVVSEAQPNIVSVTGFMQPDPHDEPISRIGVVQTDPLLDGNDDAADHIVGLHTQGNVFIAAVAPRGGSFGDEGSGLARGMLFQDDTGIYRLEQLPNLFQPVDRTQPIDIPAQQLFNAIDRPVVFTNYPGSGVLYSGFSLQSGGSSGAGARSVTLGVSRAIVQEEALRKDAIIGTNQLKTSLYVHGLSATITSTQLPYLIVHGGVGDRASTRKSIFALPLVNDVQSNAFGMVAANDVEPQPQFSQGTPRAFMGLVLSETPNAPDRMWTSTDPAVRVGGQRELPGPITDVQVDKDAVFATVPEADGSASPLPVGVFYSQAIYNGNGRIIGWTDWSPAAGAADSNVAATIFDASIGQFTHATEDSVGDITRVGRTQLQPADDLIHILASDFSQIGGLQGFVDIPYDDPSLTRTDGERLSLAIMTGLQTVAIGQTGRDDGTGRVIPHGGAQIQRKDGGSISSDDVPADGFIVSGGDLDAIGAIITADLATDGNNGWLIVGGSEGIAILQAADGTGWPGNGLQRDFANIPSLTFRRVPGINQARKVMADGANVYVLSERALYRMPLSVDNLASQVPRIETVAQVENLCPDVTATFSDMLISGTRAWLATSCGLLQLAPQRDIRTISESGSDAWQHVTLNESVGPVTRLYPISPTLHARDIATTERGGAIYALSSHVSSFQTQLYRLAVTPEVGNTVAGGSPTQSYPDYFTDRGTSYLFARGNYRNFVYSDGALWLTSRSRYAPSEDDIRVEMLPTSVRSGVPFVAARPGRFFTLSPQHRIDQPMRISASGALSLHGDFGVYVQQ